MHHVAAVLQGTPSAADGAAVSCHTTLPGQSGIRELQRRKADIIIGLSHAGERTQHFSMAAAAVYVHVHASMTALAATVKCSHAIKCTVFTVLVCNSCLCSAQCDNRRLAATVVQHTKHASCQAFLLIRKMLLPRHEVCTASPAIVCVVLQAMTVTCRLLQQFLSWT
jgi:hypothetical protein